MHEELSGLLQRARVFAKTKKIDFFDFIKEPTNKDAIEFLATLSMQEKKQLQAACMAEALIGGS